MGVITLLAGDNLAGACGDEIHDAVGADGADLFSVGGEGHIEAAIGGCEERDALVCE